MSKSSSSSSSGIGVTGLLLVAFIVLKLVGVAPIATWPWLWVIGIPFLVGFGIFVAVLLVVFIVALILFGIAALAKSR